MVLSQLRPLVEFSLNRLISSAIHFGQPHQLFLAHCESVGCQGPLGHLLERASSENERAAQRQRALLELGGDAAPQFGLPNRFRHQRSARAAIAHAPAGDPILSISNWHTSYA